MLSAELGLVSGECQRSSTLWDAGLEGTGSREQQGREWVSPEIRWTLGKECDRSSKIM